MGARTEDRGIEVDEDLHEERNEWRAQRVAWFVWLLIIGGALLGYLGPGLASRRTAASSSGDLMVEYERFVHFEAPNEMTIQIARESPGRSFELAIDRHFLGKIEVERFDPPPRSASLRGEREVYSFDVVEGRPVGAIIMHYKPTGFGVLTGSMEISGDSQAVISQFVYP